MQMKRLSTFFLLTIWLQGFTQEPIFVTVTGGDLYSLDLANCTSTFIGATGQGFGDIAFTPDGRLWGIVGGNLYQIDTANADTTLIGFTGLQGVSLVDLNDSILLIEYEQDLYGIKNTDASSYLIGNIGYTASGDLSWYDNDLFMTAGGLLIKIILNETNTSIISSSPVNNINYPTIGGEGLVTASFGSINNLVTFSGVNAYQVCHLDGSYQTLCPTIVYPNGIPGAASIRMAIQNPEPTSCVVSIQEQSIHYLRLQILPNPFSKQTTLQTDKVLANATLKLYNSLGQQVRQVNNISGQTVTLHRDNLTSGLYYLQLTQDNQTIATDKLVITD